MNEAFDYNLLSVVDHSRTENPRKEITSILIDIFNNVTLIWN